jgi:hypothetical protein
MSSNFFSPENSAVYKIMWKNIARQATDDNITRRMRIACWISKATNTHSEHVILIAFPQQHWLRERTSTLHLYVHCLSFCVALFLFMYLFLFSEQK